MGMKNIILARSFKDGKQKKYTVSDYKKYLKQEDASRKKDIANLIYHRLQEDI